MKIFITIISALLITKSFACDHADAIIGDFNDVLKDSSTTTIVSIDPNGFSVDDSYIHQVVANGKILDKDT